jgi:alkylation response protein AidB-like acyl-CoA dehydrogenase
VEVMRYLGLRTLTKLLSGGAPGAESSITKLFWSEYHKEVAELALDILGPNAIVPGDLSVGRQGIVNYAGTRNDSGSWVATFYFAQAGTIYQGSSEIQRNILAEVSLGLPKEPDKGHRSWAELQRESRWR